MWNRPPDQQQLYSYWNEVVVDWVDDDDFGTADGMGAKGSNMVSSQTSRSTDSMTWTKQLNEMDVQDLVRLGLCYVSLVQTR